MADHDISAKTLWDKALLVFLLTLVFVILLCLLPYMVITKTIAAPIDGVRCWWFFMDKFIKGFTEATKGRRYMAKF
jgi:hypothetical protein